MAVFSDVLITGGAGYVGAVLVPKLLQEGLRVRVLDLFVFGTPSEVYPEVYQHPNLTLIPGDLRDLETVQKSLQGCDAVIHLACISNDPSFELDPELGTSINLKAFEPLVEASINAGVKRFIYASSSSVYGIKSEDNVNEDLPLEPLTDYSKFKAACETILLDKTQEQEMVPLIIRPATVCGYSPRLRLDLTVNILTHHAVKNRRIRVFGGSQKRPNIHIQDMTDLYLHTLAWPDEKIARKIFNVGYENYTVREIAEMVQQGVGEDVEIVTEPTDDLRSYHISSAKILSELGFAPRYTLDDAIQELVAAFEAGKIPDSMDKDEYYNIRVMKAFQTIEQQRKDALKGVMA